MQLIKPGDASRASMSTFHFSSPPLFLAFACVAFPALRARAACLGVNAPALARPLTARSLGALPADGLLIHVSSQLTGLGLMTP
jgi:hypothetical protein